MARLGGSRLVRRILTASITGVGLLAATVGPAAAAPARAPSAPDYPVPYSFLAGLPAAFTAASPAGANNWSCRPSAAHPEPVVLVHGLLANEGDNWATMSPLLADAGYCVFAFTYGTDPGESDIGALIPMEQSAVQLGTFVQKVLTATGSAKVDLVGHSEGATMPEYWMKFLGGGALVDHFVGVAGVLRGTQADGLATLDALATAFGFGPSVDSLLGPTCGACTELLAGSAYNAKVDAGSLAVPGVRYTMIGTIYDELVQPYNSGFVNGPGDTDITVQDQCPIDFSDHLAIIADPTTGADILNALDPAHPVPVPCTLVLPVVG